MLGSRGIVEIVPAEMSVDPGVVVEFKVVVAVTIGYTPESEE